MSDVRKRLARIAHEIDKLAIRVREVSVKHSKAVEHRECAVTDLDNAIHELRCAADEEESHA